MYTILLILLASVIFTLTILLITTNQKRLNYKAKLENISIQKEEIENKKIEYSNEEVEIYRKFLFHYFDILKRTILLESQLKSDEKKYCQRLLDKINEIVYQQNGMNWDIFFETMNLIHNNFMDNLCNRYPQLDENEVKICCLEYTGYSNSDIATILDFSINTVQMKKSIIRKKIGIGGYKNIVDFFHKYVD